ncbi:twin-arginine translocase TatA/TatE family subunit [Candidatus Dojkabacteria bacterium]|jgi:TatA/E family protein of Tat protein translocase|uniref:Twin-arginine translocase TatA/TatE family subunit n=1 Tax=Candidatus Dojkabacteria bacterium TaxID=2099670 RepID=A0A5C7JA56_9BACT|nr:MAG: twin-arginine translocase TatA/TatE family subunit [Candidatus Dojkabacteria bacterium]
MLEILKNIGPTELIVILLILVVIFGTKNISDLAKRGGETFKEVKKIKKEITEVTEGDNNNS